MTEARPVRCRFAAALLPVALAFAGCAPAGPPAGIAAEDASIASHGTLDPSLAGTAWRLQSGLAGVDAAAVEITLEFEGTEAIAGLGACNRYRAELQQDASGVRIGPAMATKRGCMGPASAAESAWFDALPRVRSITRDGERLLLGLSDGGSLVLAAHGG